MPTITVGMPSRRKLSLSAEGSEYPEQNNLQPLPTVKSAFTRHKGYTGRDEATESSSNSDRGRKEGHTGSPDPGRVPEAEVAHDTS